MAQKCDGCGEIAYKLRYMPLAEKNLGYGPGTCRCAEKYLGQKTAIPKTTCNPFDITFDHVADEMGNKLHVENIRQLEAAEKRLGFQSVVLNSDSQNFDDPPQQKSISFADVHRWKFSDRQRFESNQSRR